MNQRIPIALGLLEKHRPEIVQKPLCVAGTLGGIWEEGVGRS